jgi:hypothetical protein
VPPSLFLLLTWRAHLDGHTSKQVHGSLAQQAALRHAISLFCPASSQNLTFLTMSAHLHGHTSKQVDSSLPQHSPLERHAIRPQRAPTTPRGQLHIAIFAVKKRPQICSRPYFCMSLLSSLSLLTWRAHLHSHTSKQVHGSLPQQAPLRHAISLFCPAPSQNLTFLTWSAHLHDHTSK